MNCKDKKFVSIVIPAHNEEAMLDTKFINNNILYAVN